VCKVEKICERKEVFIPLKPLLCKIGKKRNGKYLRPETRQNLNCRPAEEEEEVASIKHRDETENH